jgi:hypothetical protein
MPNALLSFKEYLRTMPRRSPGWPVKKAWKTLMIYEKKDPVKKEMIEAKLRLIEKGKGCVCLGSVLLSWLEEVVPAGCGGGRY